MKDEKGLTRRGFLQSSAGVSMASLLGLRTTAAAAEATEQRSSRVVLIRQKEVVDDDGGVDGSVLHEMLNEAMTALFETDSPAAAWKQVVAGDDVVGIKSNEWRRLPTPASLEAAIRDEVQAVGVAAESIAVDDRGVRSHAVFQRATALINVRPMRTHHWSGLGTCLKNLIPFVPRPPEYHGDSCAPLGAIWHLPELEGKVRLNILVMLTPQFHSVGPHGFSERYVWPYRGLIVGTEPVPVDATGARIIQAQRNRHFGDQRPISPPPHHIQIADSRYDLGPSDPAKIDLVRLGWMDDALI
jgi:hypothetical protein